MSQLPDNIPPSSLANFVNEEPGVEKNYDSSEIYLYHGTTCLNRFEIHLDGNIKPGRSGLIFLCTRAKDAHAYAHVACLRDKRPPVQNSLVQEPVILKIRVDQTLWQKVDYIQKINQVSEGFTPAYTVAMAEAIDISAIFDVLFCNHGCQLIAAEQGVRSFDDGKLLAGIRRLRSDDMQQSPTVQAVRKVISAKQTVYDKISGVQSIELTYEDELRRLRSSNQWH